MAVIPHGDEASRALAYRPLASQSIPTGTVDAALSGPDPMAEEPIQTKQRPRRR